MVPSAKSMSVFAFVFLCVLLNLNLLKVKNLGKLSVVSTVPCAFSRYFYKKPKKFQNLKACYGVPYELSNSSGSGILWAFSQTERLKMLGLYLKSQQ